MVGDEGGGQKWWAGSSGGRHDGGGQAVDPWIIETSRCQYITLKCT